MSRLESTRMNAYVPAPDRRQGARRLQELGVTPVGAHQAMHGQLVTDPEDRERIAKILFQLSGSRSASLNL